MTQTDLQARQYELIQQVTVAYERDAPLLCRQHTGEWVAYHGEQRIGLAKTRAEAWQQCLERGLPEGEFWIFNIQPIVAVESAGLLVMAEFLDP